MSDSSPTAPRHTNRLIDETSPYLLQHAHNPVEWYPWGEEALTRAREADTPILLSIGYSACHWCHVMERESFENAEIAALMNQHFVCIKVDREERPDLDDIYMAATLALNAGQGGWPMTVFLTPDQRPFFAGTYFPPTDSYGRPGFASLLTRISAAWRQERDAVEQQATQLSGHLRDQIAQPASRPVPVAEIETAAAQYAQRFDDTYGGFGSAPKFPPATGLSLLLRHHRRSNDAHAVHMVRATLDGMAKGGMYDHVGGGFARYSIDERWLVPHFEKMLYDNALLARAYLEAYQVTGAPFYRQVATEILDYVLREMTSPEGGFYSATDADSEGEEGKFYVWSPDEIDAILGADEARRFCAYYDITTAGNWEGKSIPNTPRPLDDVAAELGITPAELERSLEAGRQRVYEARRRRVPPGLDDKTLTAWNGLMIGAMAEGFRVLGDRRYLAGAARAADFLLTRLGRADGGLFRTYREGRAHLDAYLEDYAYLCDALIDLYEAGGAARYLREAERLAERILTDFGPREDEGGGFFSTARHHEALLLRHREGKDGATPSANAVAASALARLAFHLARDEFREAAAHAVAAYGSEIGQYPVVFARTLTVVDLLSEGPVELAFAGRADDAGLDALRRAVARQYLPNRIVGHVDPTVQDDSQLPLLVGKGLVDGKAALYVCRNFACQEPITDPANVAAATTGETRAAATVAGSSRGFVAGASRTLVGTLCRGSATPEGTAAYAERFRAGNGHVGGATAYPPLGSTGLTVGRIGFGGYRVSDQLAEHRAAFEKALLSGANLVDTSTNYTDGGSEQLVGGVIRDLCARGELRRNEVVVVSKIGYVQGRNLTLARERADAGRPYPEVVAYTDDCWHCIHPEFLQEQLGRSLARLGLETLDVCLLHNPEYFLSDAKRRDVEPLAAVRDEFYRRLREAFRFFESQVQTGTICWYGISSNTAGVRAADPEATSLDLMLQAARDAGGAGHHFRVLQLPMNLFEAGGVLERNNREGEGTGPGSEAGSTVLDIATREGIGVLVNRPLNAILGGQMVRLVDVPIEATDVDIDRQHAVVAELEDEWRQSFAPLIRSAGKASPEDFFRWAERLKDFKSRIRSREHWEQVEGQMIAPSVAELVRAIDRGLSGPVAERWTVWRDRYLSELQRWLGAFRREAAGHSRANVSRVTQTVDPLLPAERRGETLSRKALWLLASTPGVTCVLNGMRRSGYVDDALGVLAWPPLSDVTPIYQAAQGIVLPPV